MLSVAMNCWIGRFSTAVAVWAATLSMVAAEPVRLAELQRGESSRSGVVLSGETSSQIAGDTLAAIGDFNGDGVEDLATCGFRARAAKRDQAGRCYIVTGGDYALNYDMSQLAMDGRGFSVIGAEEDDQLGRAVTGIGDINGDGFDDVALGAYFAADGDVQFVGKTYVLYGRPAPYTNIDLINFEPNPGALGFVLVGANSRDVSSFALAGGEDLNGDGVSDFAIGAYLADPGERNAAGTVYLIYGRRDGDVPFPARVNLADLADASPVDATVIEGHVPGLALGDSLAMVGDVTGDGVADLAIGASRANSGFVFLLAGRAAGGRQFPSLITTAELDDWFPVVITGAEPGDRFGNAISSAGDFNGDGVGDLAVGAPNARAPSGEEAGKAYVILNTATRPGLAAITEGGPEGRLTLLGSEERNLTGFSAAGDGDTNGDGVPEVIFGAYQADAESRDAGESYLVSAGSDGSVAGNIVANTNPDRVTSYFGAGLVNDSGHSVALLDFNGDSVDDVAIGAPGASFNGSASGAVFVVFGEGSGAPPQVPGRAVSVNKLALLALALGVIIIAFLAMRRNASKAGAD